MEIKRLAEFDLWFDGLKDAVTKARLTARLKKASLGNLGDIKSVGEGVWEMREFFGPGWRMYYVQRGDVIILMLGGGTKDTQGTDIQRAKALLQTLEDSIMVKIADLPTFDAADYLDSEEVITAYLNAILEENDPALLASALGDIAKARGIAQIAKEAGLGRESLYKALREGASPRFDTISRVLKALGVKLVAVPA